MALDPRFSTFSFLPLFFLGIAHPFGFSSLYFHYFNFSFFYPCVFFPLAQVEQT